MNDLNERWRAVVDYEGSYEVSNRGRIRSLSRLDSVGRRLDGMLLRPRAHPSGHLQVTLTREGICRTVKVHRVVLEAFVGSCPDGMQGCHQNGDPADNRVCNLRWDTPKSNAQDRIDHGVQQGSSQRVCGRGHSIREPNLYLVGSRRRCRACEMEKARSGPFDKSRADQTYVDLMGGAM